MGTPVTIALFGIVFWVVYILLERKSDRVYTFSEYIKNIGEEQIPATFLERYFKPLVSVTKKSLRLKQDKREDLKVKLEQAGMRQTPEDFMITKIIYAIAFSGFFLTMFIFNGNKILLGLSVASGLMMYFYPNRMLKKRMEYAKAMRKLELPDYLTPLGLLMYSYTPYQAVKESTKFAGPFLKPFVERLQVEMDMYPGSPKPFRRFAEQVDIPEAQTFVTALQQAINTDRSRSREIIRKQVEVMRKLREESYLVLINQRPLLINKYNGLLLADMAILPMTALGVIFMDIFSKI
ncbi:hypothetical protein L1765_11095 [Microaerobacter geothermalis]|uniref:hypothetical protein n=1 Tax=Microaerobacter geothermalis TaxID=674972 RepID=UPI001F2DFEA3|nr:hypothetical protein [Microaerobacter geothermalis]MCF6094509.1 hypothetical protein [Microaerobacter geothermalis]